MNRFQRKEFVAVASCACRKPTYDGRDRRHPSFRQRPARVCALSVESPMWLSQNRQGDQLAVSATLEVAMGLSRCRFGLVLRATAV
jgi:hypothetical protein